jgi:hypothetical protein
MMKSNTACGDSTAAVRSVPPDDGGSIPTSPLHRLRKSDWNVADADKNVAERLVRKFHYAKGTSNTAVYIHGLFRAGWSWHEECVGVCWWIPPTRSAAEAWAGEKWEGVLALSRMAIDPTVPTNGCSFLLSKSARMIDRDRWHTLVSYADSWRGHTGAIYRAAGWEYCGKTNAEAVYVIRGRMVSRKAGPKTRTHSEMMQLGAEFVGRFSKSRFALRRSR